jgi:hypothetical protein
LVLVNFSSKSVIWFNRLSFEADFHLMAGWLVPGRVIMADRIFSAARTCHVG